MISLLVRVVLLTLIWVGLWGDLSPGTVVAGVAAATAIALLVRTEAGDRRQVFRPVKALAYAWVFLTQLMASTASVVRLVLSGEARDVEGTIIQVELPERAYAVRTLIAHSISLTPGTLTVDVGADGRTLSVHVMRAEDVTHARAAIAALERRATAAFVPSPSVEVT